MKISHISILLFTVVAISCYSNSREFLSNNPNITSQEISQSINLVLEKPWLQVY